MTQTTSKILLGLEALLLVVPVTLLFMIGASDLYFSVLGFQEGWLTRLLVLLIVTMALFAGWWLMVQFWRHGSGRLLSAPGYVWALVMLAAVAVVVASVLALASSTFAVLEPLAERLRILLFGLPLLIPLAHLGSERLFRSPANQSSGVQPKSAQAVTKRRTCSRASLLLAGALACFYLVARAPLPFDVRWWRVADIDDTHHRRQRMAEWMIYTGSLKGLTRTEVTSRLGESEPAEHNATGGDMVYFLGITRGLLSLGTIEVLVLRFDSDGRVGSRKSRFRSKDSRGGAQ